VGSRSSLAYHYQKRSAMRDLSQTAAACSSCGRYVSSKDGSLPPSTLSYFWVLCLHGLHAVHGAVPSRPTGRCTCSSDGVALLIGFNLWRTDNWAACLRSDMQDHESNWMRDILRQMSELEAKCTLSGCDGKQAGNSYVLCEGKCRWRSFFVYMKTNRKR